MTLASPVHLAANKAYGFDWAAVGTYGDFGSATRREPVPIIAEQTTCRITAVWCSKLEWSGSSTST